MRLLLLAALALAACAQPEPKPGQFVPAPVGALPMEMPALGSPLRPAHVRIVP
jgi:hypothetical protein